jgi:hypothetical protein
MVGAVQQREGEQNDDGGDHSYGDVIDDRGRRGSVLMHRRQLRWPR